MTNTTIDPKDVKWTMKWDTSKFPDMPESEVIFDTELALAVLLANEVVFLNNHWWKEQWPEDAKKTFSINVNCNDVFAWACADAEGLEFTQLRELYEYWEKDPMWGSAVWCCIKRNELPQKPVYDHIMKAGIWNLDALGLKPNFYETSRKK